MTRITYSEWSKMLGTDDWRAWAFFLLYRVLFLPRTPHDKRFVHNAAREALEETGFDGSIEGTAHGPQCDRPRTDHSIKSANIDGAEAFLENMKVHAEAHTHELARSIDQAESEELTLRKYLRATAGITTIVALSFAALLVYGIGSLAVFAGALGLVTGAGTLLFRQLSSQASERRISLAEARENNLNALRAIQTCLMISHSEQRDESMKNMAIRFADSALT